MKNKLTIHKWNKYKSVKEIYELELKEAESLYNNKLARSLEHERNSSKWWSTVKHLLGKGGDSSVYPPLEHNDAFIYDNKDKADVFNNFFIMNSDIDTSNAALPSFRFVTPSRLEKN